MALQTWERAIFGECGPQGKSISFLDAAPGIVGGGSATGVDSDPSRIFVLHILREGVRLGICPGSKESGLASDNRWTRCPEERIHQGRNDICSARSGCALSRGGFTRLGY